ncbi:MAG TPA: flavin reductase family protein [Dehalococcoidia bacterium]|nr:flavin reductase family protein [Dehalococcoidia bacterium]
MPEGAGTMEADRSGTPIGGSRARELRTAFPTGVTIVTSRLGESLHGVTVTSFCFASLDPPRVVIALERHSRSAEAIAASGVFAVHLPSWREMFLADRFAGREAPVDGQFSGVAYRPGVTGAPLLTGAIAWLECRVSTIWPSGDHTLFLTDVIAGEGGFGGDPLIYFRRSYRRLEE